MVSTYLEVDDILLGIQAKSKQQLFEAIGKHMQHTHGVPADSVASSLQRREAAGSTALGFGVAIPHARVKELDRIRMLYARLMPALAFDTPDSEAVFDVVVLLVPAPATQEHLDLLARVAALFSDKAFRKALHACQEPVHIHDVFVGWPH